MAAVVIDNGSGLCKAGLAGEKEPKVIFTNIVGRAKAKSVMIGAKQKDCYIGDKAQAKRGVLTLSYPVKNGVVESWDDMEKIWRYVFDEQLKVKSKDFKCMVTEAPLNPLANREKMAQVLFEKFEVPSLYAAIQGVLAMYAAGRITGLALDSGDGVTHTMPIYEGYCIPHAVLRLNMAGRSITKYLVRILTESGHTFTSTAELEIVRNMKETLCFVSVDIKGDMAKKKEEFEKEYKLPDGKVIKIHNQVFRAPETLFQPQNIGMEAALGVDKIVYNSIMKCDIDVRKDLYANIVLAGGSTLFPGMDDRLTKEVTAKAPPGTTVKCHAAPERKTSAWSGGSILASLSGFADQWVTAAEYKEVGPNIIFQKCF
uniref:actin, cytoplasmic-like isoform X2 n=1 Tax=Myxine glutinosa TaxID=7769 RepID=UPI00358EE650